MKNLNFAIVYFLIAIFVIGCKKDENSNPTPNVTVTDIDGNIYKTVTIGTQIWMVENLKTTKYRNGDAIINMTSNTSWTTQTNGAYCWYSNTTSNKTTYGALYNWYAVADNRNIAPIGWHIPTDVEWTKLSTYLGGTAITGSKLKEIGTTHWQSPNADATNETGFTAVPGGYRDGYDGTYGNIRNMGLYWTSTEYFNTGALQRVMENNVSDLGKGDGAKNDGYSVRCVKD